MLKFISVLFVFTLVLFTVHYLVIQQFFSVIFFYQIWQKYLFLAITTLGVFSIVNFVHKNFSDKSGFAFVGLTLFKMAASIIFFIPLMQSETANKVPDVLNFFIPYFLYLILEVVFCVRLINSK